MTLTTEQWISVWRIPLAARRLVHPNRHLPVRPVPVAPPSQDSAVPHPLWAAWRALRFGHVLVHATVRPPLPDRPDWRRRAGAVFLSCGEVADSSGEARVRKERGGRDGVPVAARRRRGGARYDGNAQHVLVP